LIGHDNVPARLHIGRRAEQPLTPRRVGEQRSSFISLGHDDLDEFVRKGRLHPFYARGVELIRMEGTLGEPVSAPPPMLGRPHRNIRSTRGLALPKVLAFTPREQPIEVRRAELKVDIGGSERDPLARMGFGAVRAAYLHRVNLAAGGLPLPCGLVSPLSFMKHWLLRSH